MTLGIHDFGLFVASAVLLNLTPGQDTLYILGRTLSHGRQIGFAAAFGVCTGTALHSLAAALGVSAIVATSDAAFIVLKLLGAAYLVYLGFDLMRHRRTEPSTLAASNAASAGAAFRQGVLTNVTNPKVALFFLAFLPQFVAPDGSHRLAALLVLGLTFVATSTVWCTILVASAAALRRTFSPTGRAASLMSRAAGLLFIALGIRLALSER